MPQHNKSHKWESYCQHYNQHAKTKSFPPKMRNKTRVSAFTTSIQHSIGSPSHSNKTRKRNKKHSNWKGWSKTVIVCRWHVSVHRKSYRLHQNTTQPNKWIWQSSRIQSQYSVIKGIFVHQKWNIRNGNLENIPFIIATRKIKYLGINITMVVKDLYTENYRTLKKEIESDINKWKHIPCPRIGRINIIKMSILPKVVNTILIKIPMTHFTDLEQIFLKCICNQKWPQVASGILRKKN